MTLQAALLPLFVQVGLTFVLLFIMGSRRIGSIRRGETRIGDIALGERAWPQQALKAANSFHNQFELPVLFYVLTILAIIGQKDDILFIILAWVFVISRIVHAAIHATSNQVPQRLYVYAFGAIVLVVMWVIYALRILLAF